MTVLNILIVEDDILARITLGERMKHMGHVLFAGSAEEAKAKLKKYIVDLVFVDLDLDRELEGLTLIPLIKKNNSYAVVLSAREEESVIRKAYDIGCDDYLVKPYSQKSIELVFRKYNQLNIKDSIRQLLIDRFHTTNSDLIDQIDTISNALLSDKPILILGETGTGKTYLAKTIHMLSGEHKPFVHLNCSEFSEQLLESELFGHVAGAFTGAIKNKKGMLEIANDGILFLDEVATMPESLQKKILKAIEEKEFYPVGGEKPIKSHFRLISATCDNLREKVLDGGFRQDLYFRIEGFNLTLKPLRERKEDIIALIKHFIKNGDRRFVINDDAIELLNDYSWPGNIREMQKMIDVMRSKEKGIININDIESLLLNRNKAQRIGMDQVKKIGLNAYVESIEIQILEEVFNSNQNKVRKTLNDLKISNNSFYRIMDKMKLKKNGTHE